MIRDLGARDFEDALALYEELTLGGPISRESAAFGAILSHPGTAILGAEEEGRIVSMATLHLMPNMTYGGRPYGLAENVVTLAAHRGRGLGKAVMTALLERAWEAGAYKVMLLTGTRRGAAGFYRACGFSDEEKHGMIARRA